MRGYRYSVGLALGALLLAGCGDTDSPSLPGLQPPAQDQGQIAVEQVRFLPADPVNNVSQALEATNFSLDFINPEFLGVQVRSGEQGSGTASVSNVVSKIGRLQSNPGDVGQLAIQLFGGPILISAFAPDDAPLSASVGLSVSAADGTVVPLTIASGQPLNLNTNSLPISIGTSFLLLVATDADGEEITDEGLPIVRLEVTNILTNAPENRIENLSLGDQVVLQGNAIVQARTTAGVQNLSTGEVSTTAEGSSGDLNIGAVLENGRFSGTFTLVSCAPTNCLSL